MSGDSDHDDSDGPIPTSVHRWIGVIGLVVAPTTLVTGLCYYFGYTATRKSLAYLGIDTDAVGFTTNDYVTRSTGVLFVVALIALVVCTAVLALCAYIRRIAEAGRHVRALRLAAWSLLVLGGAGVVRGVVGVVQPGVLWDHYVPLTPLTLGVGAALVMMGAWIFRRTTPVDERPALVAVERALVAVAVAVVVLAAFWTTNIFATKVGEIDGINAAGNLWNRETSAILDTGDRLFIPESLVRTSVLTEAGSPQGETFRYECLRVLAVRGDQWVLLPANWRPQFGYAVLVSEDANHRIMLRSIKDAPERVGNRPNVRDFYPCPELVPTSSGPTVQTQLLPAADVDRILLTSGLSTAREAVDESSADGSDEQTCSATVDSTTQRFSTRTGFTKRYVRELSGQDHGVRLFVQESVTEFDTPQHAGDFLANAKSVWQSCRDTEVAINTEGTIEHHRIGAVNDDDALVLADVSSPASRGDCRHAATARSNIVADVIVCGPTARDLTALLVHALRDRFRETP
ncbi:sensor domain-containing protein [Mycolicibacterium goodii]|uniref:sensor domain-containing protein n=1 Tax=Mycolicibacterium goodii TaxID=134601 RepID=UPI001BDC5172|nr:sensor domain-containing protein [Mycolicibacterium goodii]MBU8813735.1 sensor domain-containing protein [Mycolicibacterium goodii]